MKEATGESALTLITIVIVTASIGAVATIIAVLVGNQSKRAYCDDAGGYFSNGECKSPSGSNCIPNMVDGKVKGYNCS